jgi:cysteine desulfurase
VGLGRAAEVAYARLEESTERISELRDYLENEVMRRLPEVTINGSKHRVPNITNLRFQGVDGESLLIALDLKGIAVSTGSACSSGSLDPSHVLSAMGLGREEVRASLRFSLSYYTTREEIDYTITVIEETVTRLRHLAQDKKSESALSL